MAKLHPLPLFAVVGLLLAACVPVYSTAPLFKEDAAAAPGFQDGVWVVSSPDQPCQLDDKKALKDWPDCAQPYVFRGARYFTVKTDTAAMMSAATAEGAAPTAKPEITWVSHDLVLAAGTPRTLQSMEQAGPGKVWGYHFVTPKGERDGRVTTFDMVSVFCSLDMDAFMKLAMSGGEPEKINIFTVKGAELCRITTMDQLNRERDAALERVRKGEQDKLTEEGMMALMGADKPKAKMTFVMNARWLRPVEPRDRVPAP